MKKPHMQVYTNVVRYSLFSWGPVRPNMLNKPINMPMYMYEYTYVWIKQPYLTITIRLHSIFKKCLWITVTRDVTAETKAAWRELHELYWIRKSFKTQSQEKKLHESMDRLDNKLTLRPIFHFQRDFRMRLIFKR